MSEQRYLIRKDQNYSTDEKQQQIQASVHIQLGQRATQVRIAHACIITCSPSDYCGESTAHPDLSQLLCTHTKHLRSALLTNRNGTTFFLKKKKKIIEEDKKKHMLRYD